jgi:hypothetical protein
MLGKESQALEVLMAFERAKSVVGQRQGGVFVHHRVLDRLWSSWGYLIARV